NARIAPGSGQTFGFQGTYSGSFSRPAGFSLNGTACS
ncbi:cellulose binding domain-containing protein, partial [Streptomyces scabiei]